MTPVQKPQASRVVRLSDVIKQEASTFQHDSSPQQNDESDPIAVIDDNAHVTFRQIGDLTGEKPNTLSARTFPKVVKLHEGLEGHPPLQHAPGKPTGYAAKAIVRFLELEKDEAKYRAELQAANQPKAESARQVEAEIVLSQPADFTQKLSDRIIRLEDDEMTILAEVALKIQTSKSLTQETEEDRKKRLYKESFTRRLKQLGNDLEDQTIQLQAEMDAEELFNQMQES